MSTGTKQWKPHREDSPPDRVVCREGFYMTTEWLAQHKIREKIAPNHFASHFFLMENSEVYSDVCGEDLSDEYLDLRLPGPKP